MHEYDVALKSILMRPGSALLAELTGLPDLRWLNVELPKVNNRRVDMLGRSPDGELVAIEFQSRNERHFPFRMGEYLFGVGRIYGQLPRQIVIYVGDAPLRMKNRIEGAGLSYEFQMMDIRDLDGERLLASEVLSDNVIAILTRLGGEPGAVRRILKRIAAGRPAERERAFSELLIVACLRKLDGEVKREAKKMPILNDIRDSEVFGGAYREGRVEGQMELLLGLIEKRFGAVPPRVRKRLAALKPEQIKAAGLRILDAHSIEDLFGK
jgi:hypothetical protein